MTPSAPRSAPLLDRRGVLLGAAGLGAAAAGCRAARGAGPAPVEEEQRLDALLSTLTDQRASFAPIAPEEKRGRIRRLVALLATHSVDAFLVEPGATLRYLSGVDWGLSERLFALVVCADGGFFWVVPAFEAPRAQAVIEAKGPAGPLLTWEEHEYPWKPLARELSARRCRRLAVEPRARAFVAAELDEVLGRDNVVPGLPLVRALRGRKSAAELALLRGANELTQQAIVAVAATLAPGVTDREIGARMRRAQERLGLEDPWVLPLIGPSAAAPHGGPEGRALAAGDVVLVDTGGTLLDYQSDITRTWVFGAEPAGDVRAAWSTVRDAQRAAFAAIRPGAPCRDVDRAARATIEAAGYGAGYASFPHRLGHGIGLDGHEDPYFDGGSEVLLEPGMTFSDEPGIYLPGRFGVRLEDVVVVTADGAEVFGSWQGSPGSPAPG